MKEQTRYFFSKRGYMILSMMQRELRLIKKIPSLFVMVFIYPVLMIGLFFAIYHAGSITQAPIAVVDQDQSPLSRNLIQRVAASPEVLVAERYNDVNSAKKSLLSANIYAVVMIPPDFEMHVLANTQPEITTFYNNQYMTVGSTVNRAISTSLSGLISEMQLKKITSNSVPIAIGKNQLQPISIDLRPLFNPTLNFIYTLVSGVLPTIMQVIIIFTITASMHIEKQYQPRLCSLRRLANHNSARFFIHKCGIYFLIFLVPLLLLDAVMINYYAMTIKGSMLLLLMGHVLFISSSLAIGMMLATFIDNKISNFGVAGIIASPAFGFTGLMFPRLAMNSFAYLWGGLLPVTWYIQLRLDQTLRGFTSIEALLPIVSMLLLTLLPLCLIGVKFKRDRIRGVI